MFKASAMISWRATCVRSLLAGRLKLISSRSVVWMRWSWPLTRLSFSRAYSSQSRRWSICTSELIDVSGLPTSWAMPAASRPNAAIFSWWRTWAWDSCSSRVRSAMRASSCAWFSRRAALSCARCSPTPLSSRASASLAQVTQPSTTSMRASASGRRSSGGSAVYKAA